MKYEDDRPIYSNKERGAAFVELALTLPIFMVALLALMWIGVLFNTRSSLTTAVGTAVRLATTRGDKRLVGSEIIADVEAYRSGSAPTAALRNLLASPDQWGTYETFYNDLGTSPAGPVFELSLREMHPEYIYALIYAYDSLRQSVGPTVRFPCDPNSESGGGCVNCTFLNPDTMSVSDPYSTTPDPPRRSIGMQCRMQPTLLLLTPTLNLLRLLTGEAGISRIILSRSIFFHSPTTE